MVSHSTPKANKSLESPRSCPEATPEAERAPKPSLPEPLYQPYAEKPGQAEPPYEPYRGM